MTNTSQISSQIDALNALHESKLQIKKELKASKANIMYKVHGIISPAKSGKQNSNSISQLVSNGFAIYEGVRLGLSVLSAFRSLFGRRRRRHYY
jgi:hypothetical protein